MTEPQKKAMREKYLKRFHKDTYALTNQLAKELNEDVDWWFKILDKEVSRSVSEERERILNLIKKYRDENKDTMIWGNDMKFTIRDIISLISQDHE